jgi:alkanesulfonate monooxygenase SsuD/methylene tetrahydromethanopterin reductase-like flavin-dependent oxidoreductase (luciferase family)
MRASHRENVRGALDQLGGQRLAAQIADVYAFAFANLDGVKARRLAANRVHAGGRDLDVFAVTDQPAEQSFRDWTAADIASANKEDAFHDGAALACARQLKSNLPIVDLKLEDIV